VRFRPSPLAGEQGRRVLRTDGDDYVIEALASELEIVVNARLRYASPGGFPAVRAMKRAAAAGNTCSRSAAGSSRSVAARPPPRVSRSVLTKICADACSGAVFSAARQSASHR
jgi:hypothetical protein